MTIFFLIPQSIIWSVIGFVFGYVSARLWISFVAYCDTKTPPRLIPWRLKNCDNCVELGYHHGYTDGLARNPHYFTKERPLLWPSTAPERCNICGEPYVGLAQDCHCTISSVPKCRLVERGAESGMRQDDNGNTMSDWSAPPVDRNTLCRICKEKPATCVLRLGITPVCEGCRWAVTKIGPPLRDAQNDDDDSHGPLGY